MTRTYLDSDARQWLTVAIEHGAKIGKASNGLFVVFNQPDSFLWDSYFSRAETAARAYCRVHGLTWPNTAASPAALAAARVFQREQAELDLARARRFMRASDEEEARKRLAALS